jgi:hypothetical protein
MENCFLSEKNPDCGAWLHKFARSLGGGDYRNMTTKCGVAKLALVKSTIAQTREYR